MKKLFIVVLNHNQPADTINCLGSCEGIRINGVGVEVVAVDNGSTDSSVKRIRKEFPDITLLENYRNLGFADGVNKGIKYALDNKADYVFLLNNDAVLAKGCLKRLVERMRRGRNIGIIGPKIYYMQSKLKRIWYAGGKVDKWRFSAGHIGHKEIDEGKFNEEKEIDYVSGAAILVKKEVFEKIGFFNPDYFLYYEDADFCLRARSEGFRVLYHPAAVVYHKASVFHKNPLFHYYMTRNHFLFLEKHASVVVKIREYLRLFLTLVEILAEEPEIRRARLFAIEDYFKRRFGKSERFI